MATRKKKSFWDDEDVQAAVTKGQWIKFTEIGDVKEGVVAKLDQRVFDAGTDKERSAIEITFEDESIATCGQMKLMEALLQLRPEIGDDLTIELADVEKRGNRTLKYWKVIHTNSEGETQSLDQTAE